MDIKKDGSVNTLYTEKTPSVNKREMERFLHSKRKELEEEAVKTQQKLKFLDSTLEWLRKDGSFMDYNVSLKTMPERYVASVRQVIPDYGCEGMIWEMVSRELEPQKVQQAVPCYGIAVFHDEGYKEHDPDELVTEVCFPVKKK